MIDNGGTVTFPSLKKYTMVNNNLGSGSFGKTVLLQDDFINELFVGKKYEPENFTDKAIFYDNFLSEIKILYKLNHKNIVRIFDYYAVNASYTGYIIMEYIQGKNIEDFFDMYWDYYDSISIDNVFLQLIEAFSYIENKNIVHRDVREGNILIDLSGTVKLIDFGIGKIFHSQVTNFDSLRSEINRENSDTLPSEYYEGVYTSKTDMFYLGELLNRLLNHGEYKYDFSFQSMLDKMMRKRPEDRYSSFAEISEILSNKAFSMLDITRDDKSTYQYIANSIFDAISYFSDEKKFVMDVLLFRQKLESLLEVNCFEDYITNVSDLISVIVISGYVYKSKMKVEIAGIQNFYNWFLSLSERVQQLVLNNLKHKISKIKTVYSSEESPF